MEIIQTMDQVVDNTEAVLSGDWSGPFQQGYRNNTYGAPPGSPNHCKAKYRFPGLQPGDYEVFATWYPYSNRATNARYAIINPPPDLTIDVNQQAAPFGYQYDGALWTRIFVLPGWTNEDLEVWLLPFGANGWVMADGIAIRRTDVQHVQVPGTLLVRQGKVIGYLQPLPKM